MEKEFLTAVELFTNIDDFLKYLSLATYALSNNGKFVSESVQKKRDALRNRIMLNYSVSQILYCTGIAKFN